MERGCAAALGLLLLDAMGEGLRVELEFACTATDGQRESLASDSTAASRQDFQQSKRPDHKGTGPIDGGTHLPLPPLRRQFSLDEIGQMADSLERLQFRCLELDFERSFDGDDQVDVVKGIPLGDVASAEPRRKGEGLVVEEIMEYGSELRVNVLDLHPFRVPLWPLGKMGAGRFQRFGVAVLFCALRERRRFRCLEVAQVLHRRVWRMPRIGRCGVKGQTVRTALQRAAYDVPGS